MLNCETLNPNILCKPCVGEHSACCGQRQRNFQPNKGCSVRTNLMSQVGEKLYFSLKSRLGLFLNGHFPPAGRVCAPAAAYFLGFSRTRGSADFPWIPSPHPLLTWFHSSPLSLPPHITLSPSSENSPFTNQCLIWFGGQKYSLWWIRVQDDFRLTQIYPALWERKAAKRRQKDKQTKRQKRKKEKKTRNKKTKRKNVFRLIWEERSEIGGWLGKTVQQVGCPLLPS